MVYLGKMIWWFRNPRTNHRSDVFETLRKEADKLPTSTGEFAGGRIFIEGMVKNRVKGIEHFSPGRYVWGMSTQLHMYIYIYIIYTHTSYRISMTLWYFMCLLWITISYHIIYIYTYHAVACDLLLPNSYHLLWGLLPHNGSPFHVISPQNCSSCA